MYAQLSLHSRYLNFVSSRRNDITGLYSLQFKNTMFSFLDWDRLSAPITPNNKFEKVYQVGFEQDMWHLKSKTNLINHNLNLDIKQSKDVLTCSAPSVELSALGWKTKSSSIYWRTGVSGGKAFANKFYFKTKLKSTRYNHYLLLWSKNFSIKGLQYAFVLEHLFKLNKDEQQQEKLKKHETDKIISPETIFLYDFDKWVKFLLTPLSIVNDLDLSLQANPEPIALPTKYQKPDTLSFNLLKFTQNQLPNTKFNFSEKKKEKDLFICLSWNITLLLI